MLGCIHSSIHIPLQMDYYNVHGYLLLYDALPRMYDHVFAIYLKPLFSPAYKGIFVKAGLLEKVTPPRWRNHMSNAKL